MNLQLLHGKKKTKKTGGKGYCKISTPLRTYLWNMNPQLLNDKKQVETVTVKLLTLYNIFTRI